MQHIVEYFGEVRGHRYRVRLGVVPEGVVNARKGINYYWRYRAIKEHSSDGCGAYPTTRIWGDVELIGKWPVTVHKDDIDDEDLAELLYEEIEERCRTTLDAAKESGETLTEGLAMLKEIGPTLGRQRASGTRSTLH